MASANVFDMEVVHGELERMYDSDETSKSDDLEQTDMFFRQDATSEEQKVHLVLDRSAVYKYFFFQVTNHRSPSGETITTRLLNLRVCQKRQ